MKKLFLHIGSHKTGTTSIQKSLMFNRDLLEDWGGCYFNEDYRGVENHLGNTNSWILCNKENLGESKSAVINDLEKLSDRLKFFSNKKNKVIMSAESFSWIFSKEEIRRLRKKLLDIFDVVEVIVYLRRQDKHIISHHQQGSKSPFLPASTYYGNCPTAIPKAKENYNEYLDYNYRIGIWGDEFGDENITIRIFETEKLKEKDAVIDFFSILGVDGEIKTFRINESLGFEKTKVGHIVNNVLKGKERKVVRRFLSNQGKALPARKEAKDLYSRYLESNKTLFNRFGVCHKELGFSDCFNEYPSSPMDLWDEESANNAIANILKAVKAFSCIMINPKYLIDASDKLKHIDPSLSHKLKQAAKNIEGM